MDDNWHTFYIPPPPKWKVEISPMVYFTVADPPNYFWRTAQYLILGFKWKRLE